MASHVASPPPYTELNNPKSVEGCYPAPSFPPQQPGPPQQQMIVVQHPVAPTFVYQPHPVSMTGAIVLSCVVFWCFGWLFGAIAFILASKSIIHSFIRSFVLETYIAPLQETTTQRRSQPSHGQKKEDFREMSNLEGWTISTERSSKGRSFHADGPTIEKALRCIIAKRARG